MGPPKERSNRPGRLGHLSFISRRNTAQFRPEKHYIVHEWGLSRNGQATFFVISRRNTAPPRPNGASPRMGEPPSLFIPIRNTAQPGPQKHCIVHEWASPGTGKPPFLFISRQNTARPRPKKTLYSTRTGPLQERASHLFYSCPEGIQPNLAPKRII